eukprot:gene4658-5533_t
MLDRMTGGLYKSTPHRVVRNASGRDRLSFPLFFDPNFFARVQRIDGLPPRCREAFVLYKFDGLSYAEVAERMGISVRTVEMQLRIAMAACWDCLERDGK